MRLMGSIFSLAGVSAALTLASLSLAWAGTPTPAPLAGVTGPAGLVVAGLVYGGYLLYRRSRRHG